MNSGDPITWNWLSATIPGFSSSSAHLAGGAWDNKWRFLIHSQTPFWELIANRGRNTVTMDCTTCQQITTICNLLGIPMKGGGV